MAVAVSIRQRVALPRTEALSALALPASILTVVLAGCGQYALAVGRNELRGGLLYALAFASLALALYAQARTGEREAETTPSVRRLPARWVVAGAAVVLHIVELALILADSPFWLLIALLGALSLGLAATAVAWPQRPPGPSLPSSFLRLGAAFPLTTRRAEALAVSGIVLIAGLLRCVNLEGFPTGIHGDETEFGMNALSVLNGAGPHPFGTMFLGDPALFAYVEAPFLAVFGRTILALRVLAALTGTLAVLVCYLFTRQLFGKRVALLAAALLAVAAAHIHFSRLGLNVPQIPVFTMVCFSLLWRGHTTGRNVWFLLAGMTAGLAVYFHFPGRALAPMLGAFMVYQAIRSRAITLDWVRKSALLALGATMTVAPIVVHSLGQWNKFTEHVGGRLLWNQWDRVVARHQTDDPLLIGLLQLKVNLLAFLSVGDVSEFYTFAGAPLEIGLIAPLMALGVILMLVRINDPRYAILAIWFWTNVVLGGALTIDSPQFHRLHPALPAALIGAALVLNWLIDTWGGVRSRLERPFVVGLAALLIAVAGTIDASWYFGPWARAYPWPEVTAQARAIAALGPAYQVFNAGRPYIFVVHGNTRYLAGDVAPRDLGSASDLPAPPLTRPLAVTVNPGLRTYLPLLRELYPGGTTTPIERPAGRLVLTQFTVPAERAVEAWPEDRGLTVELWLPNARTPSSRKADLAVASRLLAERAPESGRPFRAVWLGDLVVPKDGSYQLELFTDGEARLRLDGREILKTDASTERPGSKVIGINLKAGVRALELEYRYERGPGAIEFIWLPPGGERSIVPPSALRPRP